MIEQSESRTAFAPTLAEGDEVLELGASFDLDSFQVVRREFFAHLSEPALTFNDGKIYVNAACLAKFPTVDFVQVMINNEANILALRPCPESARDCLQWCTVSKGKRKPRQTTGRIFTAMLFQRMGWNADYRYKLLGKVASANGEYLVAFDLTATEVFQRPAPEDGKKRASQRPIFPEDWKMQFGLPLREHRKTLQINTFDGYTVFAVKDRKAAPEPEQPSMTAAPPEGGGTHG